MEFKTTYVMRGFGDLADPKYNGGFKAGLHEPLLFDSLEEALVYLDKWLGPLDEQDGEYEKVDPEDDRILIWELPPLGNPRVVWHFSGWHWEYDEYGEQGCLIGHEKSLYSESLY